MAARISCSYRSGFEAGLDIVELDILAAILPGQADLVARPSVEGCLFDRIHRRVPSGFMQIAVEVGVEFLFDEFLALFEHGPGHWLQRPAIRAVESLDDVADSAEV